ncbi:MAG TPA: FoF1 ATP synthase subunit gamma [Candidatus Saccharimonadales bacterium]|nr:FoF1 ATP synthase subunit gamma [Candidatus Saccharimonadales bacterium]
MRRALAIQKEVAQVGTIKDLTSAFEGIASLRIAKIKNKVTASQLFFAELWQIYRQLRVDPNQRLTHSKHRSNSKAKDVFIAVTSDGGLSGDIDEKIVKQLLVQYDEKATDIIVIGAHGATLLTQRGVRISKYFKLPDTDKPLDVSPIISCLDGYRQTAVFYESYVSLAVQEVRRIDLISAVQTLSGQLEPDQGVISGRDYLFEPSLDEVASYMESVMLGIALSQVLLDSKLAQYASRFNAMSMAESRAKELASDLRLDYNRAKRGESDKRLKEVVNSLEAN